jgi:hypothetical protein
MSGARTASGGGEVGGSDVCDDAGSGGRAGDLARPAAGAFDVPESAGHATSSGSVEPGGSEFADGAGSGGDAGDPAKPAPGAALAGGGTGAARSGPRTRARSSRKPANSSDGRPRR